MYSLNLRTVRSPYNDTTKGSVLSQEEVDKNFINLKGDSIFSSSTNNGIVSLMKLNGETIEFTGGTATFNSITKTELDNLILISGLTEGTFYKILGVDVDLYGGTDIILQATSPSTLSSYGNGIFYNPKYESIGIWDNTTKILINNQVGNFQPNENLTADNGATGTIIGLPGTESVILVSTGGDWETVANITGDTSLTTADMTSFENQYTYAIGAKVIWGGRVWVNLNGNLGSSVDNMTLDSEWELVPFNETDYLKVSDVISYDITNDHIFYRKDKMNEVKIVNDLLFFVNSIQRFPWGNSNVFNTKIDNGFIDNLINFNGGYIFNLNIGLGGAFNFEYIGKNASIENLTINSLSYFDGLFLGNNNIIQNVYLEEATAFFGLIVANKDDSGSDCGVYNIKLNQGINTDFFENNVYIYNLTLYPNTFFNNIILESASVTNETSLKNITLFNETQMFNIKLGQSSVFKDSIFGVSSFVCDIELGISSIIQYITTGSQCTFANIKLEGGSSEVGYSKIDSILLHKQTYFLSIIIGLNAQIIEMEALNGSYISDINLNSGSYIVNTFIGEGSGLKFINLNVYSYIIDTLIGDFSEISGLYLATNSTFDSNIIGNHSTLSDLIIGEDSSFNINSLADDTSISNLTIGNNAECIENTINNSYILNNIIIGDACFLNLATIASNIQNKVITIGFNNFPAELDITNMTSLPISPISYAGEITLTSSNSSETVNLINLSQRLYPVTLKPASGLTLNITGTPAASISSITEVLSPVSTITLNGDTHDQATIITNDSYTRVIDYKNYL